MHHVPGHGPARLIAALKAQPDALLLAPVPLHFGRFPCTSVVTLAAKLTVMAPPDLKKLPPAPRSVGLRRQGTIS
jgi:hypothetical protein